MNDPFGRRQGESLVVCVTTPFFDGDELQQMLSEHVGDVQVHFTEYNESRDVRASKGANSGQELTGLPTPEITDETKAIWQTAHMFIGLDLPADAASLTPNLRLFQTASAGVDHIDKALLATMGAQLASANGIASASIAEFVMARLLEVWKNLRGLEDNQREQCWAELFGTEVGGRTLLIVGLGSIGREIARRARAFDMHVIATRSSAAPGDTDPDVDELHPAADLDSLLPRADAVVCALPSSPATMDLFNEERFRAMQPDAVFANVGRGTLVVEDDLVAVLNDGHLRAAILDVMRTEPPPPGDQLWDAPRMYLSSHCAVSLDRYQDNAWVIATENVRRFMAGERLHNEVELPSG